MTDGINGRKGKKKEKTIAEKRHFEDPFLCSFSNSGVVKHVVMMYTRYYCRNDIVTVRYPSSHLTVSGEGVLGQRNHSVTKKNGLSFIFFCLSFELTFTSIHTDLNGRKKTNCATWSVSRRRRRRLCIYFIHGILSLLHS